MKTYWAFILLPLVFLLNGCNTLTAESQDWPYHGWTQEDVTSAILSRSVPHHWGQKDQEVPNNGWSDYAYLKYEPPNGDRYLILKQHQGELSAEIYIANAKAMHAISIPEAGIFYQGKNAPTCMPDYIEVPGLEAELLLFILSEAFPDGPNSIDRKMSVKVHGDKARTLRFMQASLERPPDWNAEVTIEPVAVSQYVISMLVQTSEGSGLITLHWKGQGGEVVSSNEPLSNWLTCWHGIRSKEGKGYPFVKNVESLQTFGELRSRLSSH